MNNFSVFREKPPQAAALKQFGPLHEALLGSFLGGFALVVVAMPSNEWLWKSRVQRNQQTYGMRLIRALKALKPS